MSTMWLPKSTTVIETGAPAFGDVKNGKGTSYARFTEESLAE